MRNIEHKHNEAFSSALQGPVNNNRENISMVPRTLSLLCIYGHGVTVWTLVQWSLRFSSYTFQNAKLHPKAYFRFSIGFTISLPFLQTLKCPGTPEVLLARRQPRPRSLIGAASDLAKGVTVAGGKTTVFITETQTETVISAAGTIVAGSSTETKVLASGGTLTAAASTITINTGIDAATNAAGQDSGNVSCSSNRNSNSLTVLGVAIGASLGAAFLAALGFGLFEKRKVRRLEAIMRSTPGMAVAAATAASGREGNWYGNSGFGPSELGEREAQEMPTKTL
jgi:hypothetical protein